MKRLLKFSLFILVLIGLVVFAVDKWVKKSTANQIYSDIVKIPENKVGLLLGTSKYLQNGHINYYYKFRIDAAVALYKAGKIKYIIVSGDNGNKGYNEPEMMYNDLVAHGVNALHIFLDYAGFRTLDSMLRCESIFNTNKFTVISQQFHNERALFIGNNKDLDVIAYNAKDISKVAGWRVQFREKLARCKMLLDIVFNKQAKFDGPKINIG